MDFRDKVMEKYEQNFVAHEQYSTPWAKKKKKKYIYIYFLFVLFLV